MTLRVKYLSTTRDASGCREEQVRLPSQSTLRDVLRWVKRRHGMSLPDPGVMIILNGLGYRQLAHELDTPLQGGDTVCLAPLVSGG